MSVETTYYQKMKKCNKPGCRKCLQGGEGHGPYWFRSQVVNGRTVETYVGRRLPSEMQQIGRSHQSLFVGREYEIHLLRETLFRAEKSTKIKVVKQGQPLPLPFEVSTSNQTCIIQGDAGIGKTRLAEEIARDAKQRGWSIVWSRIYSQERNAPYHLWEEVLRKAMLNGTWQQDEMALHPIRYQPLVALLPELADSLSHAAPSIAPSREQEHLRLWEAICSLLIYVADEVPLLIVLDDLHWADSRSCEVLAYLARRIANHQLVFIGTCRDNELPESHTFRSLLAELQREQVLEVFPLQPLSPAQVDSLVTHVPQAPHLSRKLTQQIREQAAGNPFFVEELVRSVREQSSASFAATHSTAMLPVTITALLNQRLKHLSAACQQLLKSAAVLGGAFDVATICAMEGTHEVDESTIIDLIEEGLQSGTLTEEAEETQVTYHIWHPLMVNHLYESLSRARRSLLHRRAAEIVRRRYQEEDGAALVTHHLLQGGGDPDEIAQVAEIAGDHAYTLSAYPDAETFYRLAVEHTHKQRCQDKDAHLRLASLLERLAECTLVQGKTEEARLLYEQALKAHDELTEQQKETLDPKQEAQIRALLLAEIGWTWRYAGDTSKAIESRKQGEQVLQLAGITEGPAWASLHYQHGSICWQEGNYEEARNYAQIALDLFEKWSSHASKTPRPVGATRIQRTLLGDPVDVGRLHMLLAAIAATVGSSDEAESHLKIAHTLFEQYDCQHEMAIVCCNLGDLYLRQAKYSLAQTALSRAAAITERINDLPSLSVALGNLGILKSRQGQLAEAEKYYKRALVLAEQVDNPIYLSLLNAYLSQILGERRQFKEAEVALEVALKIGRTTRNSACIAFALVSLARLRLIQSTGHDEARSLQKAKCTLEHVLRMEEVEAETQTEGHFILAQVLLALHKTEEAQIVANKAREEALHYRLQWLLPLIEQLIEPQNIHVEQNTLP